MYINPENYRHFVRPYGVICANWHRMTPMTIEASTAGIRTHLFGMALAKMRLI